MTSNRWWDSRCRLRALGAEVRVCALPDCVERLAESACRWCRSVDVHPQNVPMSCRKRT